MKRVNFSYGRAERIRDSPVVASENNSASTGLLTLLHEVLVNKPLTVVCLLQLLSQVIVAHASGVDH